MANNNIHINVTTNAGGVSKEFGKIGSSVTSAANKTKTLDKAFDFLDKAVNSGKISLQTYSQIVDRLDKEETQLYATLGQTTSALKRQGDAAVQSSKHMSRTGVMTQQAGYQIGDFLVQVQSGQNAMVAFGQQATQMAGTLTLLGGRYVAIGTALGIAVPLVTAIGAAFMRSNKEAKKAIKSISEGVESLQEKIESVTEAVGSFATVMASLRESEVQDAWKDLAEAFSSEFDANLIERVFGNLAQNLRGTAEGFGDTAGRISGEKFAEAFGAEGILTQQTLANIQKAVEDLDIQSLEFYIENLSAFEATANRTGRAFLQNLINTLDVAEGFTKEVKEAAAEIEDVYRFGGKFADLDIELGVQGAAKAAELLADSLGISVREAMALVAISSGSVAGGRGRDPREFSNYFEYLQQIREQEGSGSQQSLPRGGSSADALDSLMKRIALDEQLLGVSQERAQVMRALASSEREYSASAIEGAIKRLEAYNQEKERIAEIQGIYDTAQSSLEDGFMAMVDGTKTVEDAFKDMARSIIKELYDVLVVQQLVGSFDRASGKGSGIMGFIGSALESFDGGGYTGSGPRSGGMDGRGGYLAMLHPRETVVDHTKAGSSGGGSQRVDVRVFVDDTGNFNAKVEQISSRVVSRASPSIVKQSVGAVINQTKRGGAVKDVFR